VFHLLGLGPARAAVPKLEAGAAFGPDDRALAERLLRRGAAAATVANDARLTLEEGAAAALLASPAGAYTRPLFGSTQALSAG
jgi:hypothetical protein